MNAVKVLVGERVCFHWLMDGGRTCCGRRLRDLNVLERLSLESLPEGFLCRSCSVYVDSLRRAGANLSTGETFVTLPPSRGKLFKDGPAHHTGGISHGGVRLQ